MQRCFRDWLSRTYHGDVTELRAAWNDPTASFETAQVPSALAQLTTTHMAFRDPHYEQAVIDAYRCLADRCADLVVDFCSTVKTATQGQALAGAFYGYLMELAWNAGFFAENVDSPYSTTQRSGHLGLNRVLHAPEVDFLVSPYSYGFRGIGGYGAAMPPSESMRRHGKLFIFEDDTRTHLAPIDAASGARPRRTTARPSSSGTSPRRSPAAMASGGWATPGISTRCGRRLLAPCWPGSRNWAPSPSRWTGRRALRSRCWSTTRATITSRCAATWIWP